MGKHKQNTQNKVDMMQKDKIQKNKIQKLQNENGTKFKPDKMQSN